MRRRAAFLGGVLLCGVFFSVMRPPETRFGEELSPGALSNLLHPLPGSEPSSENSVPSVIYIHAEWCADCTAFEARLRKSDAESALKRFRRYQFDATAASVWPFLASAGIESVPAMFILEGKQSRALAAYSRMPSEALIGFLDGMP